MPPTKEQFILDVRQAARLAEKPIVVTNSTLANPDLVAKTLQQGPRWLTPEVVAHYNAADFAVAAPELQDGLAKAVAAFRSIAAAVSASQPATGEQPAQGEAAFRALVVAVRAIVLPEWEHAVQQLFTATQSWANELGWVTRTVPKRLSETLLGTYTLPQLLMHAAPSLYVLDPVARFVPGATGAFDLSVQPSFYTISLYRDYAGAWVAHHDVGESANNGKREPWSKDVLAKCVEELGVLQ